ncbi:MAG: MBL fold metallo-hydrolase [Cyanobacteria bacterium J06626_14]
MHLTYYGANSWLLEFDDLRVLIDPWLVGSLVFGNMPWLFKGDRTEPIEELPTDIDLILLSQGLEDHAHRLTLQQLSHTIPVIASPNGAKVAKELSYSTVVALQPGESHTFNNVLDIRALSGAPIGLNVENGYWLHHEPSHMSLYYEPHGFPPSALENLEDVDIAISPVVNLELPLAGAIIQGQKTALEIAKALQPKVFLPTAAGGDIQYSGLLDKILTSVGGGNQFEQALTDSGLSTKFVSPQPQVSFEVC